MDGETEFVNLVSYVPIEPRVDRDPPAQSGGRNASLERRVYPSV
jgi:hypothetical protein